MVVVVLSALHLVRIQQNTASVLRSWRAPQTELPQHHKDSYIQVDCRPAPWSELKLVIELLSEAVVCTFPIRLLPGTAVMIERALADWRNLKECSVCVDGHCYPSH